MQPVKCEDLDSGSKLGMSAIDIGDLEYSPGPAGASEVVTGPPCVVAIVWIAVFSSN
jgi:hypothetical protein